MVLKRRNESLQQNSNTLGNFINDLRCMPEDEAQFALMRLRSASDAASVLRSIRCDLDLPVEHVTEQTLVGTVMPPAHSEEELDLMSQHPNAYPLLDGSDERMLFQSPLLQPLETSKRGYAQSSDLNHSSATFSQITPSTAVSMYDGVESKINYCDPRLEQLNVAFWTVVPVTNEQAARAISMYLETDHPILGVFDADLFIHGLVNCQVDYCSSFLVSSLLAFASVSRAVPTR